jgi:manganese transport protein
MSVKAAIPPGPLDRVDSLHELHQSVSTPGAGAGFWKTLRAFFGPAVLISVGYMDPGNWGTDLQAGAMFKYRLLWVVAAASGMAVIMQVLAARLGIVAGKDLARCSADWYPHWMRWPNWIGAEIAIGACDLAEVLGSAVALHLLFGLPMLAAVLITAGDVLLLLALERFGMRKIEAIILMLVLTIAGCYAVEIFVLPQTRPSLLEMTRALVRPTLERGKMLEIAIGIVGATVMPHNLYLHSALVGTRKFGSDEPSVRRAIKYNTIDSVVALTAAFFVNAAILILAAIVFAGRTGITPPGGAFVAFNDDSDWIKIAYLTLTPLLGAAAASTLFAIALLASGQSSTITGTLAGQVVMEGFMHWRLSPALRRIITRSLAIIPAVFVIGLHGDGSTTELLVLSQVVLAIQLPLAMFPLLQFTSSKKRMGQWRSGWILLAAGWVSAVLITVMDVWGLPESVKDAWGVITGR